MHQAEYQKSGSVSQGDAAEELDFNDLTEQINEYEKALSERMQAYHEGTYSSTFLCPHESTVSGAQLLILLLSFVSFGLTFLFLIYRPERGPFQSDPADARQAWMAFEARPAQRTGTGVKYPRAEHHNIGKRTKNYDKLAESLHLGG